MQNSTASIGLNNGNLQCSLQADNLIITKANFNWLTTNNNQNIFNETFPQSPLTNFTYASNLSNQIFSKFVNQQVS